MHRPRLCHHGWPDQHPFRNAIVLLWFHASGNKGHRQLNAGRKWNFYWKPWRLSCAVAHPISSSVDPKNPLKIKIFHPMLHPNKVTVRKPKAISIPKEGCESSTQITYSWSGGRCHKSCSLTVWQKPPDQREKPRYELQQFPGGESQIGSYV